MCTRSKGSSDAMTCKVVAVQLNNTADLALKGKMCSALPAVHLRDCWLDVVS